MMFKSQPRATTHAAVIVVATGLLIAAMYGRMGAASDCTNTSVGLTPISDLGADFYLADQGGLYADGVNSRPEAHELAGLDQSALIQPLDQNGFPDPNGRIVFTSIGGSTTEMNFKYFKTVADAAPDKNPAVLIFNGARASARAEKWAEVRHKVWDELDVKLSKVGVTPAQVQVAWVKASDQDTEAEFEEDVQILQERLRRIAQNLKFHLPNIKVAYFSSRMYGGYADRISPGSPEPHAYGTGFAVKRVIAEQIGGSPDLTYDSTSGPGLAPWIAWGPYIWADGIQPRSDGLFYVCKDFKSDGEHPGKGARVKVTDLLLDFLRTDSTAQSWFVRP
jgi:hypothetical protein